MPVLQRVSVSLKNILVATDFSSVSDIAAAYAKALALNFRSNVVIAHVFDPSMVTAYVEAIFAPPVKQRRQHSAMKAWSGCSRILPPPALKCAPSLPEGHPPHAALLQIWRSEHDADLIVAGTHSKWGLERLVLGSTAEELIRNAVCPVLTVGPHARQPEAARWSSAPSFTRPTFPCKPPRPRSSRSPSRRTAARIFTSATSPARKPLPAESEALDAAFNAALNKMIPESVYEWCTPETVVEHGHACRCDSGTGRQSSTRI